MIVLHGYQTFPVEVIADRESQIEREIMADAGCYDSPETQTVEAPESWAAEIMDAVYNATKDRWD
jgi:hypothetical protein